MNKEIEQIMKEVEPTTPKDEGSAKTIKDLQDDLKYLVDRFGAEYLLVDEDLRFESGDQWDDLKDEREKDDRPCYVTDFVRGQVNRICNPYILNPLSISIDKARSTLSKGIEKGVQFELDKILRDYNGDDSILNGFRSAVIAGRGFVHITSKYTSNDNTNQQVIFEQIKDPSTVYIDGEEIDGSDATVGVYIQMIGEFEAKQEYGDDVCGSDLSSVYGNYTIPSGMIPIILYYKKEKSFETITNELDGENGLLSVSRQVERIVINCYKIVGSNVVSTTKLDMPYIPIIPIYGQRNVTSNGFSYGGIVQQVKDSQRLINLYSSLEAEIIGKAPASPYIGTADQIKGYEEEWSNSNKKNYGVLPYNSETIAGKPIPPPNRQSQTVDTGALIQSKESAKGDMAKSTSLFDNMFGNSEKAESGIALQSKNFQGEIATAHFTDNLNKSLKQMGKVAIYYMQLIYDYERNIVVDGQVIPIVFSALDVVPEEVLFTSSGGASTESKKQLAVHNLGQLATMNPNAAPLISTYMIPYMDIENGDKLKSQLEKMIDPSILMNDDEKAEDPEAIKALETANETIEQMKATTANLLSIIGQYQDAQLNDERDRETDLTKEQIKAETDVATTQIKADASVDVARIKANATYQERDLANRYDVAKQVVARIDGQVDDAIVEQSLIDPQSELEQMKTENPKEPDYIPLADGPLVTNPDIEVGDL